MCLDADFDQQEKSMSSLVCYFDSLRPFRLEFKVDGNWKIQMISVRIIRNRAFDSKTLTQCGLITKQLISDEIASSGLMYYLPC